MAATNFKTENNTFRKLIGNGLTYRIPRFQRDYSWTQDEWEDLWMDIRGTISEGGEPSHYMGYLVLQSADDKTFDVIDGQQRLTTLSIIVLAALKNFQKLVDSNNEAEPNKQRLEQIRQTYVGYLDPVTLVSRPKLSLNRNNNAYYQNHLVPLGHLPQRSLRASEHLLRRAFEWFDKQIGLMLRESRGEEGRRLAQFVENLSDRLFFTVITVTDELNAYKVFETLNARGVRLSATDLLKNYLFSVLDRGQQSDLELRNLEDRWEVIVGKLQGENFPDFLRVHWNSRHGFSRQADLFKTIRQQIRGSAEVFQLIRGMEEDLDTYLALVSPEGGDWPANDKDNCSVLKTFRVRQPFPLLLAGKRMLNASDFSGLLRATVVISFRFNVIGSQSTGEQERIYNSVAVQISDESLVSLTSILQAMRSIYVEDRSFKAAFSEKVIRTTDARNNRVVRYVLCALERALSGQDYDFYSDTFNVEHILPQNAPDGWGGFSNEEMESLTYRLGNMTLLETAANRRIGALPYSDRKTAYSDSGFEISRRIAQEYEAWTPERIASRQNWMANQATSIWRISQLD